MYPYYFNRIDVMDSLSCEMIVPSSSALAELSAAASIASAAGYRYLYKSDINFPVSFGSAAEDIHNQMVFAIDPEIQKGTGYLRLSQTEDNTILLVSGGDEEGLLKAVNLLRNEDYIKQFSGSEYTIESMVSNEDREFSAREDGLYMLSDFGYSDVNLEGAFHQQTSFTIKQPDAIAGDRGSNVEIHFRHSDALVGDTSLLTVYFDNVAAASIQLSSANADGGSLKVRIPEENLKRDVINIGIDVYNYLGKIDCSKDWYDVAWTVIDSDSIICFEPSDYNTLATLDHFPSFNATTRDQEHVVLAVTPKVNEETAEILTSFAARAAQNSLSSPRYEIRTGFSAAEHEDLVFLGTAGSLKIPEEIKSLLYVSYETDGYKIKDDIHTIPEALQDQIVIQTVRSPYDYTRKVYVITYPDDSYETAVLNLLKDKKQLSKIGGVVSLLSKDGTVSVLETEETAERNIPVTFERLVNKVVRKTGISRTGLVIIAVCLLVILMMLILASRKKNRFSEAEKKMKKTNDSNPDSSEEEDEEDFEQDDR
ncbi:MAG: cellulose biosynthesis cyclic di-GMP-binding regulatory protein BcsB [Solobacterium sp.]|nr:cellulose biosynthesis cyclic di-GMP-binding regulatory protein BcsB [Solobacterium sp.]MBR2676437.1 cellulose biosynthesis cyclic di-GMP-binding regulatory protein BcsB [Solobacterium sp.]